MTDEFAKSDLHTYDLAGNLTRYRNRQNDTIRTTYDAMNRPVTQHVGQVKVESSEVSMYGQIAGTVLVPTDTRSFQYDAMGRLQRAENNVAITWRDYTREGSVSRDSQHVKISPVTKNTIRYTYHPSGARKTMQTAGRTFTYDYGTGSVLDDMTWGSGEQVSFTYDGLSRRIGMTSAAPNGVAVATAEYRLDKDGRLYRLLTRRPTGGDTLVDVEYSTLDALGRPMLITDRSPAGSGDGVILSRAFAYDRRGQIVRTGWWRNTSGAGYMQHLYDASGNRIWELTQCNPQYAACNDTTQFVHWLNGQSPTNRLGRRLSWLGGQSSGYEEHVYEYDHDGNNILDIWLDPAWPNQDTIFLHRYYSAEGKLQATRPTSATANLFFLYDALGRRQRGAYADSTNLFFYDGENTVKFGFASFLPGPGVDEPLVAFFGSGNYCPGNGSTYNGYFTTNGNRLHDVYADGTMDDSCIGQYNPWTAWAKHSGAILDSETFDLQRSPGSNDALSFFRNRFYDPKMGRFTQEDPIGFAGGLNLYAYAGNNPATYTDPFGLCPEGQIEVRGECVDVLTGAPLLVTPGSALAGGARIAGAVGGGVRGARIISQARTVLGSAGVRNSQGRCAIWRVGRGADRGSNDRLRAGTLGIGHDAVRGEWFCSWSACILVFSRACEDRVARAPPSTHEWRRIGRFRCLCRRGNRRRSQFRRSRIPNWPPAPNLVRS